MQKLYLSIPEPCHENWQAMTVTEQGRFCNACAKKVVDLSMMTDTEVLNYFTRVSDEKVCGRALPSQLERTISYPKESKKRLFWYWNYIVMFLMFFSRSNTSKAQAYSKPISELNPIKTISQQLQGRVGGLNMQTENVLIGKIIDEKNNPLPFAYVLLANSKQGVSADEEGKFSIRVGSNDKDTLEISTIGFERKQVAIKNYKAGNIILQRNTRSAFLGEVVITVAGGIARRGCSAPINKPVEQNVINDTLKVLFTYPVRLIKPNSSTIIEIFPNPVKRGSSFALSLKLKQTGNYHIQITDAVGRIVLQKQTSVLSKEYMEQVQTNSTWAAGIYNMNVFDKKNKLISKLRFIVK